MDKLKQVLKFQFWILLSVALILPLVAWSMTTSNLALEAEERAKALTSLSDLLKSDTNDPNKDWETGLEAINVQQAVQPKMAAKVLYERQLPLMTWPAKMPSDLTKFQNVHGEYYRTAYRQMVEDVRKIVNPFDEDTQTGLVIYGEELLPAPDGEWVSQAPSAKQVEAAQEDLWLLSSLLKQIASVNDDEEAKTQFEAPIRQIVELYLRGGSATKGTGGGGGGGGGKSTGGGGGIAGGMAGKSLESMNASKLMSGSGGMGGMGGGNAGGGGGTTISSAKINPEDDLGAEQAAAGDKPAASDSKSSGGGVKNVTGGMSGPPGGMGGGGGSGSSSSSRWSGSNMGRYRDDKPEYKTRGFYLEVVMDHRHIPDLLVALANADWPINVLHVQESDTKDEDLADAGGGAGLSGMGSRGPSGMGAAPGGRMGGGAPPGMAGGGGPSGMSMKPGAGASKGAGRSSEDSEGPVNTRSPLDDPNLANVSIVGLIYIFKKPEEKPGTTPPVPAPAPTAAPAAAPVAAVPTAGTPAAAAADGTQAEPAAAAESDPAADKDAKTEQPDSAAAPEKKPDNKPEEKPANQPGDESEKGAAPAKDAAPGNAAPEKPGKS